MENKEPNFIIPSQEQKVEQVQPPKPSHVFSNVDLTQDIKLSFDIKIVGIGGAGCNVINHIAACHPSINNVATLYAFNTDICSLKLMKNVPNIFLLNKEELKGYGSGGNPEVGKKAVIHDAEIIKNELVGTDILFIIAGMGKGAGSGGAPELAQIAKDLGILTVGIVNMPSVECEGTVIFNNAFNSLQVLKSNCNCVSTISNEKIINNNKNISFYDAYEYANNEIGNIIEDIINIIFKPSVMNIDFADLKAFFNKYEYFRSSRLSIPIQGINQFKIKEAIANKIKFSASDVNIKNTQQIIVNVCMSKKAPTSVIADINKSFIEITHNEKLSLTTGIDYHDKESIDISYLIAGTSLASNFESAFDDATSQAGTWDNPTIKIEPIDDSGPKEYDNFLKSIEEASRPTEDILKEIDQQEKNKQE